jgi:hypothetical protein
LQLICQHYHLDLLLLLLIAPEFILQDEEEMAVYGEAQAAQAALQ